MAPGVYFRLLLIGFFEGIDSERGLEWRCADSLSLRHFLRLGERGFLAVDPGGTFNERSSFHSRAYLESRWGRILSLRDFAARGFVSYQDLSVWEKPARRL